MSDQPKRPGSGRPQPPVDATAPGDEAAPGTPGTGEDICPVCGGSGETEGSTCEACLGRGRIVRGISAGP